MMADTTVDKTLSAPAFELVGVSYSYVWRQGLIQALRDVDLVIPRGQFVAVAGSNGSGKSTLASLLNAMFQPATGRVEVFGMDTSEEAHLWDIRRSVGLIMENPDNQIVGPTVADDIAFGPENLGLEHSDIVDRVAAAMAAMGIEDLAATEPHLLSEGQKQKVAIAGVLATGVDAIVSDESTGLLDPETRRAVLDRFDELRRERGITVVHITHLPEEALRADRLLVIEAGRLAADRHPAEFFGDADLVRRLGFEQPALFALAEALRERGLPVASTARAEEMVRELWP